MASIGIRLEVLQRLMHIPWNFASAASALSEGTRTLLRQRCMSVREFGLSYTEGMKMKNISSSTHPERATGACILICVSRFAERILPAILFMFALTFLNDAYLHAQGERAGTTERKTGRVDMLPIAAGNFSMGDITGSGYERERPVHKVTITRPFLMSRTEVTQELYEAVMGSNPSHVRGATLPVEKVSWYDAVEFCNALSRKEGLKPCYSGTGTKIVCDFSANGYRLPTEAEWEYAARGGKQSDFHTGNITHPGKTPLDPALDRAGWYEGNAGRKTHPVGQKEANAFGLHDMHGNVAEWCWDFYATKYYNERASKDPRGPAKGPRRILRGGGWYSTAKSCRSAFRVGSMPEFKDYYNGIRLVRTQ